MDYTPQERRYAVLLTVYSILFFLFTIGAAYHAVTDRGGERIHALLFSGIPAALFLVSFIAARGVRRNLVFQDLLSILLLLLTLLGILHLCRIGFSAPGSAHAILHTGFTLVLYLAGLFLRRAALIARFGLRQLSPVQALGYRALAEAVIGDFKAAEYSFDALVSDFDGYLDRFQSSLKISVKLIYWAIQFLPLLYLNPPLTWMGVEERKRFIQKRFGAASGMMRTIIRSGKQLVYFIYYGNKPSFASTGYRMFEERARFAQMPPKPDPRPLEVRLISAPEKIETDICVIGSGAAGAVVAYNLAKNTGRKVTILERGKYYVPQRDFTNIEPDMIGSLYRDGGLEMTQDFDLAILQGNCLGGSTTMNNGICFRTPPAVLDLWRTLGARIDAARLESAFDAVETIIGARPLERKLVNGGANRFFEGAAKIGLEPEWFVTNFGECGGSGYCNIGCKYNRKLSMLLNYLPMALEEGAEIIADAEVLGIGMDRDRATSIRCRTSGGVAFSVAAREIVVAAGAIASSGILLRSGIRRNVGTRLSFNITTPMMAEFPDEIDSFDGVQMCCYVKGEGYLVETTFNPPGASALIMQGWFEQLNERMKRYRRFATAAPVVPSEPNGMVKRDILGRTVVDYDMTPGDFGKLKAGMKTLCRAFLAGGAVAVLPSTYGDLVVRSEADLPAIDRLVRMPADISLSSAHPQGGNPLSDDRNIGVVGSDFRVHGASNLYLCDASIFPTGVTVNPQLSIMGLAHYAADTISANI